MSALVRDVSPKISFMKKRMTTFSITPFTRLMVVTLLLLYSCTEEPIGSSRNGSSSSVSSTALDHDALQNESIQRTFSAHLTGAQERPTPVNTDGSGQAIFKLSKDGTSLSYKVIVNNLENITQSHIHCGGAEDAGPVVAFLFGFVEGGVTVNGVLAEGVITEADIIARPDTEICLGGVANFQELIEKLESGSAYINVHTTAFPGGEIRGLIK
jgi:hypothetical protein